MAFRPGDRARLKARFRAMPDDFRNEIQKDLGETAEFLAEAIRRRVPVDHGALAGSVVWKRGASKDAKVGRQQGVDTDLTVRVVEGDRDTFYAPFVEHGTKEQAAQPHFFPTYRENKREIKSRLALSMKRALKRSKK